jgi:hypothetical protein
LVLVVGVILALFWKKPAGERNNRSLQGQYE